MFLIGSRTTLPAPLFEYMLMDTLFFKMADSLLQGSKINKLEQNPSVINHRCCCFSLLRQKERSRQAVFFRLFSLLHVRILLPDPVPEAWVQAARKGHSTTSHIPDGDYSQTPSGQS